MFDIFGAGSDTASVTVEWAMSELLKNPGIMKKAQAEVRHVLNKNKKVDERELHQLSYLKQVVYETLRLHPPNPFLLPRQTRERCDINGYEIPAKTKVTINYVAIGRDPEYWSDAEIFNPERFEDSSISYKRTSFEYIPFGAGRRMCPGMGFGMTMVELMLSQLLYHFDWKLANGVKPQELDMSESFGLTLKRKNGLHVIPVAYSAQQFS
ncbi:cytochrome P450 71D10-like [Papaver somniferum]|uniref:cytochrome P450 71D10-like n=1 Tax=Papaver somniferum TaxID=3469 RepID=UPI000E6FA94D|nr:cytochrome P450 71D10-like [Papaver somniferum]